jgi:beta-phosphoglucomutase-like phosphatase (HAD superfamily)
MRSLSEIMARAISPAPMFNRFPEFGMSEFHFSPDDICAALIFDCDGTLVDTAQVHLASYNAAIAEHGQKMSWEWYSSRHGIPARDLLLVFAAEFKVGLEIERAMEIYARAFHENLALVSEVTLLAELAPSYHTKLPMAVASNGNRDHVIASLTGARLLQNCSTLL